MELNIYSSGTTLAEVSQTTIDASWAHEPGAGDRIRTLNAAFKIFHRCRQHIEQVSHFDWNASWRMWKELEDAGDSGYGTGVQDLDDAFRHLIANQGRWKDENTKAYWGHCFPSVYPYSVVNAPAAAANFLSAVNSKLAKLQQIAGAHQAARLRAEAANNARDWRSLAAALEDVKSAADSAEPFLWILPEQITTADWYESLSGILEVIDTAIDVLNQARDGLSTYAAARQAGLNAPAAAAWSAVGQAVSYLPVLGDFYAEIVRQSPALIASMRTLFETAHRKWERAAAGAQSSPVHSRVDRHYDPLIVGEQRCAVVSDGKNDMDSFGLGHLQQLISGSGASAWRNRGGIPRASD